MTCGVGAERAQLAGLGLAAGGAGDGVAVLDQEGDERTAGGAGGACDEDVHGPCDETACNAVTVVDDDLRPCSSRSPTGCSARSPRPRTSCRRRTCAARAPRTTVENERAFMTTVTTRLAIDVLRSARVRRETYVGDVAARAAGRARGARGRRGRGVGLAGDARAARAAEPGRARGVRPARVLRRRLRRDRRDRRPLRGQLPPDPLPRPPPASPTSARASTPTRRERRALAARFLAAAREGDLDGLVALLAPGRRPDRRRRRRRPLDPAPDARRRRDRPRDRRLLRPDRRAGASRWSRPGSTASRASARSTPTAGSSTSSASTSSTAASPRSTRCSTRTSSRTSARRRTSACALQSSSAPALTLTVAAVIVAGVVGGHERGDVADVLERGGAAEHRQRRRGSWSSCRRGPSKSVGIDSGTPPVRSVHDADAVRAVLGRRAARRIDSSASKRGLQAAEAVAAAAGRPSRRS